MTQSDYTAFLCRQEAANQIKLKGSNVVTEIKHELDLHEQIFAECRRRGWIAFHGAMSERTHRTLGEPDFVILADGGRLIMVECKTATGKLTKDQLAISAWAAKLGHTIHVVRTLYDLIQLC